jgi:hypothetical protein
MDPRGCRGVLRLLGVEGPVAVKYGTLGRKTAGSYRRDGDVHVIWIDHTPSAQEKARTFCHEAAHAAQQEGRATATWTATTRIGPATRTRPTSRPSGSPPASYCGGLPRPESASGD